MPDELKYAELEYIELEKLRMGLRVALSRELLGAQIELQKDIFFDQIVFCARGYIWAEQLERITIEYPADWWQAFKERWFPRWAKARWPAGYTQRVIDVKAKYPAYKPSLPSDLYPHRLCIVPHERFFWKSADA